MINLSKLAFYKSFWSTIFKPLQYILPIHASWSIKWCAIVQATLRESSIFSSLRKVQNLDSSRGLVKISASCFLVLKWQILISPLVSWSLKKWCQMSICLVLEWLTGLFASFMALSLSHKSGILVNWHPKSRRVCLIQSSGAQHAPAATYLALAVERAIKFCFLELQDTRDHPRNWHVPEMFFLSTLQPA